MKLAAVGPVLLSVQLVVAAVPAIVGVLLLQAVRLSTGGLLTCKLTGAVATTPTLGLAVSVPL